MYDYSKIREEYRDDAYLYARMILDDKLRASQSVKDACKRHLDDLVRSDKKSYRFFYSPKEAKKVIAFIELLPDVKTGKTYPLAYFQKFILSNLYGWRDKNNKKIRRFKKAFISMARKSGKTIIVAGILLYEFLFGNEPRMSRQLFCTANDRKQAKIAFEMARKQLDALRAQYKEIREVTHKTRDELKNLRDESYITYLSKETGAIDGFEPYVGVFDEYGASKTNEMMELIESGQGQLLSPLILIISTAGFDLNVPMYQIEYKRSKKILKNKIKDDEIFIFIAEQESLDEIEDENNWIKSNPILEVADVAETIVPYLRKRWKTAKETGETNKVLVKNFNMWRQASQESYLSIDHWNAVKNEEKEDIRGRKVWVGVDVGKSSDLFSITWITQSENYWHIDSHSFIATKYGLDIKEKRDGQNYRYLEEIGECDITKLESGVIDYDEVYAWLEQFIYHNDLNVQGICYDPYQFGHILTMIEKNHPEWPMIEVRQGTRTLSMPTKQFRDDVIAGKIRHDGNHLLTAAINNAITLEDNNGIRIDKSKNSNKIDPIDAGLNAYSICFTYSFDTLLNDDFVMSDDFGF